MTNVSEVCSLEQAVLKWSACTPMMPFGMDWMSLCCEGRRLQRRSPLGRAWFLSPDVNESHDKMDALQRTIIKKITLLNTKPNVISSLFLSLVFHILCLKSAD